MIKYLGSKRKLIKHLTPVTECLHHLDSFADVFSGSAIVGHTYKKMGYRVISNDYTAYGHCIATCFVEANRRDHLKDVSLLIKEFNALPGISGYITQHYSTDALYFQQKNSRKIDAIREAIEAKDLEPVLKSILITSLIKAAEGVDSTCGMQSSYIKNWSYRAHADLRLCVPHMLSSNQSCSAFKMDANEFVRSEYFEADIVYLDPPYNRLNYRNNYHIWETLVEWDMSEVYGKAKKRVDCRTIKSEYNSSSRMKPTFLDLVAGISSRLLVVSFSNEGWLSYYDIVRILSTKGTVFFKKIQHKRYIGYINKGLTNEQRDKYEDTIGQDITRYNTEYFFFCSKEEEVIRTLSRLGLDRATF